MLLMTLLLNELNGVVLREREEVVKAEAAIFVRIHAEEVAKVRSVEDVVIW